MKTAENSKRLVIALYLGPLSFQELFTFKIVSGDTIILVGGRSNLVGLSALGFHSWIFRP